MSLLLRPPVGAGFIFRLVPKMKPEIQPHGQIGKYSQGGSEANFPEAATDWLRLGHMLFGPNHFTGDVGAWRLIRPAPKFSSVTHLCPTLCDPMDCNTPGLPVHHHLQEFTQTHVH